MIPVYLQHLHILSTPTCYGVITKCQGGLIQIPILQPPPPLKPINVRQICADCDLFANLFTEHESDRDKTFPGGGKLHYSAILRVFWRLPELARAAKNCILRTFPKLPPFIICASQEGLEKQGLFSFRLHMISWNVEIPPGFGVILLELYQLEIESNNLQDN